MDCNETRRLLEADADGELDLAHHLELAAHLESCPDCARRAAGLQARRAALRGSLPRFTAPPLLAEKIRVSLHAGNAPAARKPAPRRSALLWPVWNLTGLAATLAFVLLVGYAWGGARARADRLIDEAVTDHVRSLQAAHLMDVASTDQHTVKPWFAGRLNFSPPVTDLAADGFPLAGGRLETIGGAPAAALVFHRRQHAINLFIWPATGAALPARQAASSGYNLESWSRAGLNFLAVSEIPAGELSQFAGLFRANVP